MALARWGFQHSFAFGLFFCTPTSHEQPVQALKMAPEQCLPTGHLSKFMLELKTEREANTAAMWKVIEPPSSALDEDLSRIPRGKAHVHWARQAQSGILRVLNAMIEGGTLKP